MCTPGHQHSCGHQHSYRHQCVNKPVCLLSEPLPAARANAQAHTHTMRMYTCTPDTRVCVGTATPTSPSICMDTCKYTSACVHAYNYERTHTQKDTARGSRVLTFTKSRYTGPQQKPHAKADLHTHPPAYRHSGAPACVHLRAAVSTNTHAVCCVHPPLPPSFPLSFLQMSVRCRTAEW